MHAVTIFSCKINYVFLFYFYSRSIFLFIFQDSQKASGKIPSLDTGATAVPPPASSIPKNIEKNSVDELDFLTSNLLSNMEHYKVFFLFERCIGFKECRITFVLVTNRSYLASPTSSAL